MLKRSRRRDVDADAAPQTCEHLAAAVDVAEELAIDVEEACLAPAAFASEPLGERHLVLLLHVCRKWRGIPQPIAASELRWVRPVELHALAMPPADRPLIALLEALV